MRIVLGLIVAAVLTVSNSMNSLAKPISLQLRPVTATKAKAISTTFVATYSSDGMISCGGSLSYFYNAAMTPRLSMNPPGFLCGYYLSPQTGSFPFNGGTISVNTSVPLSFPFGVQLSGPCSTGTCTVMLSNSQTSAAIPAFTQSPTLAVSAQSNAAFTMKVTLST